MNETLRRRPGSKAALVTGRRQAAGRVRQAVGDRTSEPPTDGKGVEFDGFTAVSDAVIGTAEVYGHRPKRPHRPRGWLLPAEASDHRDPAIRGKQDPRVPWGIAGDGSRRPDQPGCRAEGIIVSRPCSGRIAEESSEFDSFSWSASSAYVECCPPTRVPRGGATFAPASCRSPNKGPTAAAVT
jgi:hypothetical protein